MPFVLTPQVWGRPALTAREGARGRGGLGAYSLFISPAGDGGRSSLSRSCGQVAGVHAPGHCAGRRGGDRGAGVPGRRGGGGGRAGELRERRAARAIAPQRPSRRAEEPNAGLVPERRRLPVRAIRALSMPSPLTPRGPPREPTTGGGGVNVAIRSGETQHGSGGTPRADRRRTGAGWRGLVRVERVRRAMAGRPLRGLYALRGQGEVPEARASTSACSSRVSRPACITARTSRRTSSCSLASACC